MKSTLKPGDCALAVFTRPALRVLAVRVRRVWVSVAGTIRCEVEATEANGRPLRPKMSFDRRELISLEALENLSAESAVAQMAGAESQTAAA